MNGQPYRIAATVHSEDEASVEWLEAHATSDGYVLVDTPVYAAGISSGDVVSVTKDEDGLRIDRVLRSGGFATFRILASDARGNDMLTRDLLDRLIDAGGTVVSPYPNLFAVSIRGGLGLLSALRILEHGEEQSVWAYEVRNLPV